MTATRRVALSGCVNFRDVGGYRTAEGRSVRRGRLFRSDGLHELSSQDVATVRDELGVRTVFDLRSPAELAELTIGRLYDDGAVRHVHAPLFTEPLAHWPLAPGEEWTPARGARVYFDFLEVGREYIAAIAGALAEPSTYPAVLHCVAGRDRTGVLCALLLETLGVAQEDIVDDSLLTGEVITEYPINAEVIRGLLRRVHDAHGSAEGYLRGAGVTATDLEQIRELLLD